MTKKQYGLEQLRKYRGIQKVEYGMYVEVAGKYHGYLTMADADHIYLTNGTEKNVCFHPTWKVCYYDDPINKNIIYEFSR